MEWSDFGCNDVKMAQLEQDTDTLKYTTWGHNTTRAKHDHSVQNNTFTFTSLNVTRSRQDLSSARQRPTRIPVQYAKRS